MRKFRNRVFGGKAGLWIRRPSAVAPVVEEQEEPLDPEPEPTRRSRGRFGGQKRRTLSETLVWHATESSVQAGHTKLSTGEAEDDQNKEWQLFEQDEEIIEATKSSSCEKLSAPDKEWVNQQRAYFAKLDGTAMSVERPTPHQPPPTVRPAKRICLSLTTGN